MRPFADAQGDGKKKGLRATEKRDPSHSSRGVEEQRFFEQPRFGNGRGVSRKNVAYYLKEHELRYNNKKHEESAKSKSM